MNNMKLKISYLKIFSFLLLLFFFGCGEKKPEIKPVPEMTVYKDPKFAFEISRPKDWISNSSVGNARFISSEAGANHFIDPFNATQAKDARIMVLAMKTGESADVLAKAYKDSSIAEGKIADKDEDIEISGVKGKKVTISANYGKDKKMKSFRVFFVKDSLAQIIECAAFNMGYEEWTPTFDAVIKTIKFGAVPGSKTASAATEKPSEVFASYSTPYFTLQYPDNFDFSSPAKGKNDLSVEVKGFRLDCTIRIDVFGAQKLNVDKVIEQNKAKYAGTPAKTTIDGNPAYVINYNAAKNVSSKAYFVVKNDKVIRLTVNWFTPETDTYKPAFDKVVASMKLK
jgi:hypothetical protein